MSMPHTNDPGRAKSFYGDVFGWRHESVDFGSGEITLWRLPGYVGGESEQPVPRDVVGVMMLLDRPGNAGEAQPHWSVDFWIDDADAAAARASGLGGDVIVPPHDTPGFRSAVLADPYGAAFSVSRLTAGP
jgi:predicted enzyme related to lactoylglutathione lyase